MSDNRNLIRNEAALEYFNEFKQFRLEKHDQINQIVNEILVKDKKELQLECQNILASLLEYEKKLTASLVFLPAYDARQCQLQLKELFDLLEEAKTKVVPKTKFSFKNKTKSGPAALLPSKNPKIQSEKVDEKLVCDAEYSDRNLNKIANKSDSTICVSDDKCDSVKIENISNCKIVVQRGSGLPIHCLGTLHICNVENSVIIVETPVYGSAMLEACTDCTIVLACKQFRMHKSTKCRISLLCISLPIIEDCSELCFAPFVFAAPPLGAAKAHDVLLEYYSGENQFTSGSEELRQFEREYTAAQSEDAYPDTAIFNFNRVNDFNWIKAAHSPNWRSFRFDEYQTFYNDFYKSLDTQ